MEQKNQHREHKGYILIATIIGIVVGVGISIWQGSAYWLIGAGSGIGVMLGVRWGNRKARKVDAYREEWLGKRNSGSKPKGNSTPEDP